MNKQAQLEIAAFLGSPQATGLRGIEGDELRRVVGELVYASHTQLGKRPNELDGQDLRALLLQHMPGIFEPKDPTAERVPEIVDAFLDHLEQAYVPTYGFELRNALSESTEEYLALARSTAPRTRTSAIPRETFVHRASKVGRNDPCSCGSGKKYKKCHGKDA